MHKLSDEFQFCDVADLTFGRDHVLTVRFDDGFERAIDLEPILIGLLFGPLRDLRLFSRPGSIRTWGPSSGQPEQTSNRRCCTIGLNTSMRSYSTQAPLWSGDACARECSARGSDRKIVSTIISLSCAPIAAPYHCIIAKHALIRLRTNSSPPAQATAASASAQGIDAVLLSVRRDASVTDVGT